jgi:hypothetical protein
LRASHERLPVSGAVDEIFIRESIETAAQRGGLRDKPVEVPRKKRRHRVR